MAPSPREGRTHDHRIGALAAPLPLSRRRFRCGGSRTRPPDRSRKGGRMSSRWLAKLRSIVRPEVALAVLALPLFFDSCIPDTPPDEVRTIEGFVECLNNRILLGDIADAVQCLPCGCTLTLTQSRRSAQPACIEGNCQLPRVLVN